MIRRDPPDGKNGFSTRSGFTIIELMVVIAIIAIITSFALPSYQTLIEKRRVTSTAQQMASFLSAAKMEAIRRNEEIGVSTDSDAACMGLFSYDVAAGNTDCECGLTDPDVENACAIVDLGSGVKSLRTLDNDLLNPTVNIAAIELGSGEAVVVFDPIRGALRPQDIVASPLEIQLLSHYETYALNVQLSATGRVSVCSDLTRADIYVPGYDPC
jgi:prepilin-type N-terminal cleavage/methylation domain-containing protein